MMWLLCKQTAGSFLKPFIFLVIKLPMVHQNLNGGRGVVELQSCLCQRGQKQKELKRKEVFLGGPPPLRHFLCVDPASQNK